MGPFRGTVTSATLRVENTNIAARGVFDERFFGRGGGVDVEFGGMTVKSGARERRFARTFGSE